MACCLGHYSAGSMDAQTVASMVVYLVKSLAGLKAGSKVAQRASSLVVSRADHLAESTAVSTAAY